MHSNNNNLYVKKENKWNKERTGTHIILTKASLSPNAFWHDSSSGLDAVSGPEVREEIKANGSEPAAGSGSVPAGRRSRAEEGPGRRRGAASGPGGACRRRRLESRVTSSATGHGAGTRRGSPARAAAARPGTRTWGPSARCAGWWSPPARRGAAAGSTGPSAASSARRPPGPRPGASAGTRSGRTGGAGACTGGWPRSRATRTPSPPAPGRWAATTRSRRPRSWPPTPDSRAAWAGSCWNRRDVSGGEERDRDYEQCHLASAACPLCLPNTLQTQLTHSLAPSSL